MVGICLCNAPFTILVDDNDNGWNRLWNFTTFAAAAFWIDIYYTNEEAKEPFSRVSSYLRSIDRVNSIRNDSFHRICETQILDKFIRGKISFWLRIEFSSYSEIESFILIRGFVWNERRMMSIFLIKSERIY